MRVYERYPALIQDVDLALTRSKAVKYRDFSRDITKCVVELTPQQEYTIQTYTQNTFAQSDKSLQTMYWEVPLVERYQKTFDKVADGIYKIPFETSNGQPSKVFVYIERVGDTKSVYSNCNPAVKQIDLQCLGQSINSIDSLDEYQIYEATRRNAALRCDLIALRQETGGVLFGLDDVVNWHDFTVFETRDPFKGEFVVSEDNSIRPVDTTAITTLSASENALLVDQSRQITVLFIYENHCLKGEAGNLRFWMRDNEKPKEEEKSALPVDYPDVDYGQVEDRYQASVYENRYGPLR